MTRLAIIITHPIQYYVPLFRLLYQSGQVEIMIFYTWGESAVNKFDPGFNQKIEWDIPLMDGYPYQWVKNTATDPGTHHFKGIVNPELIEAINLWKADALLIFGWSFQSHFSLMRHFKNKIPIYFRGDSTLLDNKPGIRNLIKSIGLRYVYRHIDHAFYAGTNNKAYFENYGLKSAQLTFAPHAVDNSRFALSGASDKNSLRQALKIEDTDIVILFAGKFEQKKAPDILIAAINELKRTDIHLLMVGNGPLEEALKTKAGIAGNKNIHWLNFQNQSLMPGIYQACDIFCLPSAGPGESWGLAVNEAMASGKPVLVSDKVGCTVDLVLPGITGEIFIAGDMADLNQKLSKLVADRISLSAYGANARKRITDWSLENQAAAISKELIK